MRKNRVLIIFTAFVLFVGLSYGIYVLNQEPLSYVSISINPDVELAVNTNNVVEEVIPINEDADIIISDLELVGKDVEDATKSIIDAAIETGYIDEYSDENTVVVTATNEDEETRTTLEDKVMESLNARLQEKNIYAVVVANGVNDTIRADAEKYDISNGKMLLVERAISIDQALSKEDLVAMSVKDIQAQIADYVAQRHDTMNGGTDTELKNEMKEQKTALIANYKDEVSGLKAALLDDAGVDVDKLTEEQKQQVIKDQIKNKKDEIKTRVDRVKEEVTNNLNNVSSPDAIKEKVDSVRNQVKNGKN